MNSFTFCLSYMGIGFFVAGAAFGNDGTAPEPTNIAIVIVCWPLAVALFLAFSVFSSGAWVAKKLGAGS